MEDVNYNIMRYELNEAGYLEKVFFGCASGECIGYTGNVPEGYETLEDWYEDNCNNIKAWKIVDNNLAYDVSKDAELQKIYEQEEIDNSCVTHKELYGLQKEIEDIQDINNSQYTEVSSSGKLITINNVKKVYPKLKLTNIDCYSFNKVDVVVTGKNMLPNTSYSQELAGIKFEQNEDKSITINGTSTEDIEYNIAGTSNNSSSIFAF